jgi:RNA polymerase sigma-70 factor (ECF subfamily)
MARPTIELVLELQAGDSRALHDLVGRYMPRVLRLVRQRLGPNLREKLQSMDVVQDVFIRIMRDVKNFEPRSDASFANWVSRLIANEIAEKFDFFTAQKRAAYLEVSIDPPGPDSTDRPVLQVADTRSPSPESEYRLKETQHVLEQFLDQLKPRERELIILRDLSEMTFEEIAAEMQIKPDAARIAYGRAKNNLAKIVQVFRRKPL